MKTKKTKTPKMQCEYCQYLKVYGTTCPSHSPFRLQDEQAKESQSSFQPQERNREGKKFVRNPLDMLTASDEQVPVDLLGTDEKSIGMWCELLRDEHASKDEYLSIGGLCSYAFALRSRSYSERTAIANAIRRIYAPERERERMRDDEWLRRVLSRTATLENDSSASSSRSEAGADSKRTETRTKDVPAVERKQSGPARPGVIACIIKCLTSASKKKPVTKDEILTVLVQTFPERRKEAMQSTISSQLPNGLFKEKGIKARSTEDGTGWWIRVESK